MPEPETVTNNTTILVVDDDPASLTAVSKILSQYGHKFLVANNGGKGLQVLKQQSPELVLLDI